MSDLPVTFTNSTPARDVHPNAHNETNEAVNLLRDDLTTLEDTVAALEVGSVDIDTLTDGTINHVFTAADDTKLAGIATGATANDTDANLKNRANHTGTQLASTISDLSTAVETVIDSSRPQPVMEILWNDITDFDRFQVIVHSTDDGVAAWDLSVEAYGNAASGSSSGYTNRGRWTGPGPGAEDGANSRIFYVLKTSEFAPSIGATVRQVMWDHSGVGNPNGQAGNVHGLRSIGGGQYQAIVVWHDIFVSNPRVINFNVWTTESSPGVGSSTSVTGGVNHNFVGVLDPPARVQIRQSWRTGGTVYYLLGEYDHGFEVGDDVHVVGPAANLITFTAAEVASVNGNLITCTGIVATRDTSAGGPGYIQLGGTQEPFPYVLETMMVPTGDVVYGRVFREGQPPPDWGDERYTRRWEVPSGYEVDTPGQHGITVNHLGLNKYHEAGTLRIERNDW